MKVLILNCVDFVGGSTFAEYVGNYVHFRNDTYVHISVIESIKAILRDTNLCNDDSDEKYYRFLSDFKELTDQYYDYSFKHLQEDFDYYYNGRRDDLFMVDIYDPKDIERFIKKITSKFNVDRKDICTAFITDQDVEDTIADGYKYDVVITTCGGKETLKTKAHKFIIDFMY